MTLVWLAIGEILMHVHYLFFVDITFFANRKRKDAITLFHFDTDGPNNAI